MLESIIDIVRRAGELVRSANDVTAATHEKNGPADLVTEYDLAVQRFLRQELLALLPEADFFGEEGQHDALTSPWTFIVDPIDGTTNFVRGFAYTNISVALAKDGQVEYAVVYAPLAGELYAARRAAGPPSTAGPSTSADGIPATRWWCAAPPSMTAAIRSGTSPSCGISMTGDWTTVGSGRRRWICVRCRRAGRRCSSSAGSAVGFRRREPAGAGGRGLRHHAGGDDHRSPAPRLRVCRQRPVRRADGGAAPWIRGYFRKYLKIV